MNAEILLSFFHYGLVTKSLHRRDKIGRHPGSLLGGTLGRHPGRLLGGA